MGDVFVNEPEKTAYLSDEEIENALKNVTFRRGKYRLIESLLNRFGYEVDTKIHEGEWKMTGRLAHWRTLYNRLKKELETEETGVPDGFKGRNYREACFKIALHDA